MLQSIITQQGRNEPYLNPNLGHLHDSLSVNNTNASIGGDKQNAVRDRPVPVVPVTLAAAAPVDQADKPHGDTVDGMGSITFADEIGSSYFGLSTLQPFPKSV